MSALSTPATPVEPPGAETAGSHSDGGMQVARLFGVPIYVEPKWMLVAFVLLTVVIQPRVPDYFSPAASYAIALSFAPLLYLSVLIHELGHSLVALRLGLKVQRIRLHLLGGDSEIAGEAPIPKHEFAVAIAGPALSLALFAMGYLAVQVLPPATMLIYLVALFNLLPGLPLDGGRVLQAAVWAGTGNRYWAVITAAWTGLGLAAVLLLFTPLLLVAGGGHRLISTLWAVTIALFLWSGAQQSLKLAKYRRRLSGLWARPLSRRALMVAQEATLAQAMSDRIRAHANAIVVLDAQNRPCGIVSTAAAEATPVSRRGHIQVAELMHSLTPWQLLSADLAGEALLNAMYRANANEYVVLDETTSQVVGVLHTNDVLRLVR